MHGQQYINFIFSVADVTNTSPSSTSLQHSPWRWRQYIPPKWWTFDHYTEQKYKQDNHFINAHILTLHFILNFHFSLSTHLTTAHVTFVLHPLTLFTTKPTVKPMQWRTHFGNLMTTLHLVLHLVQRVIVRSHICKDRLLNWMGLAHVWNRGLLVSLLLSDNTILLASWNIVYFTKSRVKQC